MFKQTNRWVALSLLGAIVASTLFVSAPPAQAKSSTWKKVAIGAGIVTGYGLLKHKSGLALGAGAVTAGSYLKYRHDKKREKARSAYYRRHHYSRYRNSSYRYAR